MFGSFLDAVMSIPNNMHKEEMQDDAQHHDYMAQQRNIDFNAVEAQKARDFNSAEATSARAWSEFMASTAHQRETNDLSKAGLNRILSAHKGGAVPSASSASGNAAASSGGGGSGGGGGGSTPAVFTQGELNSAQSTLMKQQGKTLKAQEISTDQQAYNYSADTEKKHGERQLLHQQKLTEEARTDLMRNQASSSAKDVARSKVEEEIDSSTYGKIMRYLDRLRGGSSAYRQFRGHD